MLEIDAPVVPRERRVPSRQVSPSHETSESAGGGPEGVMGGTCYTVTTRDYSVETREAKFIIAENTAGERGTRKNLP